MREAAAARDERQHDEWAVLHETAARGPERRQPACPRVVYAQSHKPLAQGGLPGRGFKRRAVTDPDDQDEGHTEKTELIARRAGQSQNREDQKTEKHGIDETSHVAVA
jgi:hypothetical protein